ncbi:hypothetical protein OF829_08485 [Sphingomonas sp. LB-2]|uniref:hypothetical protein n=1 Tax=Sphingomonas caeni TaxID=2984949 RepID=UPI002231FD0A|nr:hypothetical protein [Sphingomonas caeni]MCW3847276.1 hypothetical protein [Sphingomonas caeni]
MLILGLALVAATLPQQDYTAGYAEATCVVRETNSNHLARKAAIETCTTRHGWNAEEAKLAIEIGDDFALFLDERAAARSKGLDTQIIDDAFATLTQQEYDQFRRTDIADPVPPRIMAMMGQRISDPAILRLAHDLFARQVRSMNRMTDFIDLRARRR